jgi:hypothetical protein
MLDLAAAFPGPAASYTTTCSTATHCGRRQGDGGVRLGLFDLWRLRLRAGDHRFWSPWYAPIEQSDVMSRAIDHYGDMGLEVANFDSGFVAARLHIGLVHLAYNAFRGDLETLRLTDRRMCAFLD